MQAEELYYLLKPFCELGEVEGRTTAQKIFYLLQSHGYPTRLDYFLHYYGPYSEDLTSFLRFASASEPSLLEEQQVDVGPDAVRFDYRPTDDATELIQALETKIITDEQKQTVARFCEVARHLKSQSAVRLELAATILYFEKERGYNRLQASKKTQAMKPRKADADSMQAAGDLLTEIAHQAA